MMEENKNLPPEDEIQDVALQAAKMVADKEREIKDLKVKLARANLLTKPDAESDEEPFDPNHRVSKDDLPIDIFTHAVKMHDYKKSIGQESPFGKQYEHLAEFYRTCIEEADGDNEEFLRAHKQYVQ